MYIRKSKRKNKKTQKIYHDYKLVESTRTEKGPRQRVLLNLGADFDVEEEKWKELCRLIDERLRGHRQAAAFESDPELDLMAEQIVFRLTTRTAKDQAGVDAAQDRYMTVDLDSVATGQIRTVGGEWICLDMLKRLELDNKLLESGFSQKQVSLALGTITARLLFPGSERSSLWKLRNQSALGELLNFDFNGVSLNRFYEISDKLLSKKDKLEPYLYEKEQNLFSLESSIILYDLTNTFLEGSGRYNDKAKRGRSKEKRSDAPLVTLGLAVDTDGFPIRSEIMAGNASEPGTLKDMVEKLDDSQFSFQRTTIILDAGVATEKNLEWLEGEGREYIVVSRSAPPLPEEGEFETIWEKGRDKVKAKMILNSESGRWELHCHSTARERKENSIKTTFQKRLEEELEKVGQALNKKGGTKRYDKVLERVGRLRQKYSRVSGLYEITVAPDPAGRKAVSVEWSLKKEKEEKKLNGRYCLLTNRSNPKAEELLKTYHMLTGVEAAFRSMKSELGMRPVYHQKESRVDGHIFITLLAYHVMRAITFRLERSGLNLSWETIRARLGNHVLSSVYLNSANGKRAVIRTASEAESWHREIYQALGIAGPSEKGQTAIFKNT